MKAGDDGGADERAVRDGERRARALADHMPVGMFEAGPDGTYSFVNARWCAMTGHAAEEAVGRRWEFVVHPDDHERVLAERGASDRDGRDFAMEYRLCAADGRVLWVSDVTATLRDASGSVVGHVGSVADVTARKQAQAQVLLNNHMASVGTLASGVMHEINNPLTYLVTNFDLIDEELRLLVGAAAPERLQEVEELVREGRLYAEQVRRIVRGLRVFTQADPERRQHLDVHSVLDLAVSMATHELKGRARIVRDYQWVPAVEADEARLGQVFINLLVNAAQAIPEGQVERHTVRLVTRTDGSGRAFVEVHDTGSGIAPEHRDHVFDPFYTTRPVGRGAGLGLSICHGIVTALGGEISFETALGRGSTFTVALPGVPLGLSSSSAARSREAPRRQGRILVVDDDPLVGTTLRRVLEREHEVTVVESGREALTLIGAGERYDVILCDVVMPQMTGVELCVEVGRIDPEQRARMIFVTGGTFTPKTRAFLDKVPNAVVEKPFNVNSLRAMLREQVQRVRSGG